jgi:hypothetical protein
MGETPASGKGVPAVFEPARSVTGLRYVLKRGSLRFLNRRAGLGAFGSTQKRVECKHCKGVPAVFEPARSVTLLPALHTCVTDV